MRAGLTTIFLVLSVLFALMHWFAMRTDSYSYLWWADVVMHTWGGILIVLGVYVLSGLTSFRFQPTFQIILGALLITTLSWEVFEYVVGLWQPETYLTDTLQDITLGFSGGLLTYAVLRRYTMKSL